MRVTVEDDRGFVVATYSTVEGERNIGPVFSTQNAICVTALAETIQFLSVPIETQEVCLAVEARPTPRAPH